MSDCRVPLTQVRSISKGADTLKSDALAPRAALSCCGIAPLGLYWVAFASPQPLPEQLGQYKSSPMLTQWGNGMVASLVASLLPRRRECLPSLTLTLVE